MGRSDLISAPAVFEQWLSLWQQFNVHKDQYIKHCPYLRFGDLNVLDVKDISHFHGSSNTERETLNVARPSGDLANCLMAELVFLRLDNSIGTLETRCRLQLNP